jgi:hypothetical protein
VEEVLLGVGGQVESSTVHVMVLKRNHPFEIVRYVWSLALHVHPCSKSLN